MVPDLGTQEGARRLGQRCRQIGVVAEDDGQDPLIEEPQDPGPQRLCRIGCQRALEMGGPVLVAPADASLASVVFLLEPALLHQGEPDGLAFSFPEGLGKAPPLDGLQEGSRPLAAFDAQEVHQQALGGEGRVLLIREQGCHRARKAVQRGLSGDIGVVRAARGDVGQYLDPGADGRELGQGAKEESLLRLLVPAFRRIAGDGVDDAVSWIHILEGVIQQEPHVPMALGDVGIGEVVLAQDPGHPEGQTEAGHREPGAAAGWVGVSHGGSILAASLGLGRLGLALRPGRPHTRRVGDLH